jgi:hypothetical protein
VEWTIRSIYTLHESVYPEQIAILIPEPPSSVHVLGKREPK